MNIKNCALIYNSMNYDAVIASAVLKTEHPEIEVVDVSKRLPHGYEIYVWIGVEPSEHNSHFYDIRASSRHIVFLNHDKEILASEREKIRFTIFGTKQERYDSAFEVETDDLVPFPTLIDKVCQYFEIERDAYQRLSFHVSRFHKKNTEIEGLVFVYTNLKSAQDSLDHGHEFLVNNTKSQDKDDYFQEFKMVKRDLAHSYQYINVVDGDRVRSVLYTTLTGFNFHLALRLIKLSHIDFMNMAMGMNGTIVYTNLENPAFSKEQAQPLLLN